MLIPVSSRFWRCCHHCGLSPVMWRCVCCASTETTATYDNDLTPHCLCCDLFCVYVHMRIHLAFSWFTMGLRCGHQLVVRCPHRKHEAVIQAWREHYRLVLANCSANSKLTSLLAGGATNLLRKLPQNSGRRNYRASAQS